MALQGLVTSFATISLLFPSLIRMERLKDAAGTQCAADSSTSVGRHSITSDVESKANDAKHGGSADLPSAEQERRFWKEAPCDLLREHFVREHVVPHTRVHTEDFVRVVESWKYGSAWFPAYQAAHTDVEDPRFISPAVLEQRDAGIYWKPGVYFPRTQTALQPQSQNRLFDECNFSVEQNLALSTSEDCSPHETQLRLFYHPIEKQENYELNHKDGRQLLQITKTPHEPGKAGDLSYGAGFNYILMEMSTPLYLCVGSEGSNWTAVQMIYFHLTDRKAKSKLGTFCKDGSDLCDAADPSTWAEFAVNVSELQECGPYFKNDQCNFQVRQAKRNWSLIDSWSAGGNTSDISGDTQNTQKSAAMAFRFCSLVAVHALLAMALPMLIRPETL
eukprot:TRINITY_DN27575_c0_g2_i1.p1 TRINITY_DN27575_c0_g2~~TRINITY_DN27575_c0_g2_i1.p1  ORF type:complete len:407 (+),score=44.94 TRINITY_DN27575_c0_g2_i1:54-1223(+)